MSSRMNLASLDGKGRGGKGRGKGRGGKGSGYHGPQPAIRRGVVGQVGVHTARQAREPNRPFGGAHYSDGSKVPGSINVKTGDADSILRRRSQTECLGQVTYAKDHEQLQDAIRLILEAEYVDGAGPRKKLYQLMPPEEADGGGASAVGKSWANKINEIANDYRSTPPHPKALLRNLLIAEARDGMHAGEMIMHLILGNRLAVPDSDDEW
jgi:hypothetical protein